MIDPRAAFREALKSHLSAFIHRTFSEVSPGAPFEHAWYIDAIAWHLQLCRERRIKRLIINMPPRYGKSISASVAFVAWVLGHNPKERLICASYNEELAGQFARDTLKVVKSPWFEDIFPGARLGGRLANHDFRTSAGGGRYATSVGGTLTGIGADIIIVDDANRAEDSHSEASRERVREWYRSTLSSRLNDHRTGVIIIVQQRLHVEDLTGYLIESGGGWVVLNLPAIAPEDQLIPVGADAHYERKAGELLHPTRENRDRLEERRIEMGSQLFSAQYQQDPVPLDGEIVKWRWFRTYDSLPARAAGDQIVQSWDTASKAGELNDYSVGTTWLVKNQDYYLLDVLRVRATFPDLKRTIVAEARNWGADTLLIEDKGSGEQLIATLIDEAPEGVPRPIPRLPTADKITRMVGQTNKIEQGRVHLPKDAAWLAAFRSELLQFPNARYDDQVDSVSQFLEWVSDKPAVSELLIGRLTSRGIDWR